MNCYLHPENQAVAQCSQCGHGICKNCNDLYGGVCYECAENSAKAKLSEAVAFKEKAVKARKGMVTGTIIGGVIGLLIGIASSINQIGIAHGAGEVIAAILLMPIIALIMGACIGGSIVTVLIGAFRVLRKIISIFIPGDTGTGWFVAIIAIVMIGAPVAAVLAAAAPVVTIVRFFKQKKEMEKGDMMIEECNRALAALQSTTK